MSSLSFVPSSARLIWPLCTKEINPVSSEDDDYHSVRVFRDTDGGTVARA